MGKIKVIYGSPCSGKSTYVNEHLKDEDIRFDYDLLIKAISNRDSHIYSEVHLPYVIEFRELIISKSYNDNNIDTIYIIASKITDKLKEELNEFEVEYYLIDKSKEECYEQLENDENRTDKNFWKNVIDEWFEWFESYSNQESNENKVKHGKGVKQMKKTLEFKARGKDGKLNKVGTMEFKNEANNQELYFYGDIVSDAWGKWSDEDKCPNDVLEVLNSIDDSKDLNIYINSGGGSVYAGLAIYNQLKRKKCNKIVRVDGLAASIASVIMLAGDKVIIPKTAQTMIHDPWMGVWGGFNAAEFRKMADDLEACSETILNVYAENLKEGISVDEIKEMMHEETWLTGEKAAKYFNIDIEDSAMVVACASNYFEDYKNIPNNLKNKENEKDALEAEKEKILEDLYLYGV
ncbi:head maturation protease, ClpP-related [uncultured Clostridium sp.]|uniref:head maturation protease, ClpP-related n=1 Tax=uncultured Clostridium sp. TaxID=59620 RepID=UPI002639E94C|nr:head maturation protease, ClpP-related [uncultured Clostridium sp.]